MTSLASLTTDRPGSGFVPLRAAPRERATPAAALARLAGELEASGGWLGVFERGGEPAVLATCGEVSPLLGVCLRAEPSDLDREASFSIRSLPRDRTVLCAELKLDARRALAVLLAGARAAEAPAANGAAEALRRLLETTAVRLRGSGPRAAAAGRPDGAAWPPEATIHLPPEHVHGSAPAMGALYREIAAAAAGTFPVLVCGETGVGKEHVSRALHLSSQRRGGPFVAINCAAIPADLLEAEMFGIGEGVASGVQRREGCFQQAAGGTLLLDEIAELAPVLQAKLLRALQEGEVRPVGGRPRAVDVRVVAATNADLERLIGNGRFRADLYYRLAGHVLRVPPLRARRDDIPALACHFLERFAAELDRPVTGLRLGAVEALAAHSWPGNVRELAHEVRRLVRLGRWDEPIGVELLSPAVRDRPPGAECDEPDDSLGLEAHVERLERRLIGRALDCGGSLSAAARLLGISRNGLKLKCRRLGVEW